MWCGGRECVLGVGVLTLVTSLKHFGAEQYMVPVATMYGACCNPVSIPLSKPSLLLALPLIRICSFCVLGWNQEAKGLGGAAPRLADGTHLS